LLTKVVHKLLLFQLLEELKQLLVTLKYIHLHLQELLR